MRHKYYSSSPIELLIDVSVFIMVVVEQLEYSVNYRAYICKTKKREKYVKGYLNIYILLYQLYNVQKMIVVDREAAPTRALDSETPQGPLRFS